MPDLIPCPVCGKPREQSNRLSVFNAMSRCPDDRCPLSVWMDNASFERLSHNARVAEAADKLIKATQDGIEDGLIEFEDLERAVRAARDCRGKEGATA